MAEDQEWKPQTVDTQTDAAEAAIEIFKSGVGVAAMTIVAYAQGQRVGDQITEDRLRLDAAKYVCDRVMGKITGEPSHGDPWEKLVKDIHAAGKGEAK